MKSIALTQTAHRSTDFTLVLLSFLASLLILGFSPSLKAEIRFGDNPISSLSEAHRAVWKIQNIKPHAIFDGGKGDNRGTTFAVAPNLFITNFHVWDGLLYSGRPLTSIYIVQKGSSTSLKVQGVHIVSGVYDFVLFQTTKSVNHYLALEHKDFDLKSSDDLSLIGYPRGSFTIAEQKQLEGAMAYYEDILSYGFGTNIPDLQGASGGPILNSRGKVIGVFQPIKQISGKSLREFPRGNKVIGVFHTYQANIAYGTKVRDLREFLKNRKSGETPTHTKRTFCARPDNPKQCINAEKNNVRKMADQSDTLALYQMGIQYSYINETKEDWDLSISRLGQSADQGFPMAKLKRGLLYFRGKEVPRNRSLAFKDFSESARMGFAPAQRALAVMYQKGLGGADRDLDLARYWAEQSAQAGYDAAEAFLRKLPKAKKSPKVMWTVKGSNVRAGPSTSYAKIGLLEAGEEVRVIERTGNWYWLSPLSGQPRRFVYAPLLTPIRPANAAE